MAFCGNCGTQVVGEFCINCGKPTVVGEPQPKFQVRNEPEPMPPVEEVSSEPVLPPTFDVGKDQFTARDANKPIHKAEGSPKSPKTVRVRLSRKSLALLTTASLVTAAAFFPVSGNLNVVYVNDSTDQNPATELTVRTLNQTEVLLFPKTNNQVLVTGTWGSFEPISVRITPRPKADEELSFVPPQIGYLGIWNYGRDLTIVIRSTNDELSVRLEGPLITLPGNEQSTRRSLFEREFTACQESFDLEYGYQINLASRAYKNYLEFVEEANLDGTRTLFYTTWASRANELENRIGSYISLFKDIPGALGNAGEIRSDVIEALGDTRSAWRNLEQVSRDEAESKWDAAWTRIYNAEGDLSRLANQFKSSAANASMNYCNLDLTRS